MELLRDIFKFDLNILLEKLNLENFIQYFNIIDDIIKSKDVEIKLKQEYCDKILIFCLNKIFKISENESIDDSTTTSTVILKYFETCCQYASKSVFDFLLKFYLNYFIKCILSTNSDLSLNSIKMTDEIIRKLFEKSEEKYKILLKNHFLFNLKQIQLLNNYYNIIMQRVITEINEKNESISSIIDENKEFLQYLGNISLKFLFEIDNSNINLVRLCVHTIEKLIKVNLFFKNFILNKCFEIIRTSFEDNTSLVSNKKRLESYWEDINMYLLTTIADYLVVCDDDVKFLDKYQFWYLCQMSLTHTNALTRKRGLYLLKRTIDFSITNKIKIVCNDGPTGTLLFDSSLAVWNDFFLCIELFEETSASF
jgi:hypothetical protein